MHPIRTSPTQSTRDPIRRRGRAARRFVGSTMTDSLENLTEDELELMLHGADGAPDDATPLLDEAGQGATMRGDIEQIDLTDIFQTLALSKMEGVLRVCNPLEERYLYCVDGYVRPVCTAATRRRRLLTRLLRAGVVRADELRQAIARRPDTPTDLEDLLVAEGMVSSEQLEAASSVILDEQIFSLFTWRHGTFAFFRSDDAAKALGDAFGTSLEYEISSLLLEVARRSDEWAIILETLGSLDEVPARAVAAAPTESFDEILEAVWSSVDNQSTYRQLAEQTTLDLFDFARASAELLRRDLLRNVGEAELLDVADTFAGAGEHRRASVVLQTLLERDGDRGPDATMRIAAIFERLGERGRAATMVLQAAQSADRADQALALARSAHQLVPHDVANLHFLRSVLVATDGAASDEVYEVTDALIDALISDGRAQRALEIITESRQERGDVADLLTREARAHQRIGAAQEAAACYARLAAKHQAAGDKPRAVHAYEHALRLDPRKETARALASARRTRVGAAVRLVAASITITMLAAMGWIWLEQHQRDDALRDTMRELETVLAGHDHAAANQVLESWRQAFGEGDVLQDLESRVAFAQTADRQRADREARAKTTLQMSDAADTLERGDVFLAIAAYEEALDAAANPTGVGEIASKRLRSLAHRVQQAATRLFERLPPAPADVLDPSDLAENLATLRTQLPPPLLDAHRELSDLQRRNAWPSYLSDLDRLEVEAALEAAAAPISRIQTLASTYAAVLARAEQQRILDPLFREAVQREQRHDFHGALDLYRQLEHRAVAPDMRAHFRLKRERSQAISALLHENKAAAEHGDYRAAREAFERLQHAFPELPHEGLITLPLRIAGAPAGATVTVDGLARGQAPLTIQRTPGAPIKVTVSRAGFEPSSKTFEGMEPAAWQAALALRPTALRHHDAAIEAGPVPLPGGDLLLVDRRGAVTRTDGALQRVIWRRETGDLSGFLSRPILYEDVALVCSVDGRLRALGVEDGIERWSMDALPSEVQPALIGDTLVIATTNQRLHFVDLSRQTSASALLAAPVRHDLVTAGALAIAVDVRGQITAWRTDQATLWTVESHCAVQSIGVAPTGHVLATDEQGRVTQITAADGRRGWTSTLPAPPVGAVTFHQNFALLTTDASIVRLRLNDGSALPLIPAPTSSWSGVLAAHSERVVATTRGGAAHVFGIKDGAHRYQLQCGRRGRIFTTPDSLYVIRAHDVAQYHGALR